MKRFAAAIMLLIFVFGVCIYENIIIDNCYKTANKYFDKMEEEFENKDYDAAAKTAEDFQKIWSETEDKLCHFAGSNMLWEIGTNISKLSVLAKEENDEFLSEQSETNMMIKYLVKSEKYYIY